MEKIGGLHSSWSLALSQRKNLSTWIGTQCPCARSSLLRSDRRPALKLAARRSALRRPHEGNRRPWLPATTPRESES